MFEDIERLLRNSVLFVGVGGAYALSMSGLFYFVFFVQLSPNFLRFVSIQDYINTAINFLAISTLIVSALLVLVFFLSLPPLLRRSRHPQAATRRSLMARIESVSRRHYLFATIFLFSILVLVLAYNFIGAPLESPSVMDRPFLLALIPPFSLPVVGLLALSLPFDFVVRRRMLLAVFLMLPLAVSVTFGLSFGHRIKIAKNPNVEIMVRNFASAYVFVGSFERGLVVREVDSGRYRLIPWADIESVVFG